MDAQRRRLDLEGGVVVLRAEGAARRAGLFAGDILVSVNGHPTRTLQALRAMLDKTRPGEALALLVERSGSRAFVALQVP